MTLQVGSQESGVEGQNHGPELLLWMQPSFLSLVGIKMFQELQCPGVAAVKGH